MHIRDFLAQKGVELDSGNIAALTNKKAYNFGTKFMDEIGKDGHVAYGSDIDKTELEEIWDAFIDKLFSEEEVMDEEDGWYGPADIGDTVIVLYYDGEIVAYAVPNLGGRDYSVFNSAEEILNARCKDPKKEMIDYMISSMRNSRPSGRRAIKHPEDASVIFDTLHESVDEETWDVYFKYADDSGGEEDGDPRREDLTYDELVKYVKESIKKFFNNKVYGSYLYSAVDVYDEDFEEIEDSLTAAEYQRYDNKEGCSINTLKIICSPNQDSDSFNVILSGDGDVLRNDLF